MNDRELRTLIPPDLSPLDARIRAKDRGGSRLPVNARADCDSPDDRSGAAPMPRGTRSTSTPAFLSADSWDHPRWTPKTKGVHSIRFCTVHRGYYWSSYSKAPVTLVDDAASQGRQS